MTRFIDKYELKIPLDRFARDAEIIEKKFFWRSRINKPQVL